MSETLTIDLLFRTVAESAVNYVADNEGFFGGDAKALAVQAAQALLTPAARLALAVELLEPLGRTEIGISAKDFAALTEGAVVRERIEGRTLVQEARLHLGSVYVSVRCERSVTLEDARRILERAA